MSHHLPVRLTTSVLLLGTGLVPVAVASAAHASDDPPNDHFAQATVIEPDAAAGPHGFTVGGDNENASSEPGEPDHGHTSYGAAFHSLWWSWTAPRSGPASLNTCGSTFDTRLGVYTGTAVDALTEVVGNNDSTDGPCPGLLSSVTFDAVSGTTYHFAVDTNGGLTPNGHPRGLAELHFHSPPVPSDPPPSEPPPSEPPPSEPPPSDDDKTTPGTVVPITESTFKMPDFQPSRSSERDRWSFSEITRVNKAVGHALDTGQLYGKVKLILKRQAPTNYRDDLYRKPPGTAILRTKPRPGAIVHSDQAHPRTIRVTYWAPMEDPGYRRYLEEQEELKRKRCKLLDLSEHDINVAFQSLTYDRAAAIIKHPFWGECKVFVEETRYNNRIFRDYVVKVTKHKDQNGFGLTVVRPKTPDFAIVLREDPRFLTDSSFTSLVPDSGGWALPASPNTLKFTVQVVERSTGRLVSGANVQLWKVDASGVRTLLDTTTNGDGDLAVKARWRHRMTVYISATVTRGSMQMSATRQLEVRDLGNRIETPCGRVLTRSGSGQEYVGNATQLQRCQQMEVVPGNLGDGRGSAAPHTALPGQTEAITVKDGQILAGTYNAVDISGENIIVGAGPGLLILGGGDVQSYTTGHPLNMLNHLLTDLDDAVESGLSNIQTSLQLGGDRRHPGHQERPGRPRVRDQPVVADLRERPRDHLDGRRQSHRSCRRQHHRRWRRQPHRSRGRQHHRCRRRQHHRRGWRQPDADARGSHPHRHTGGLTR